MEEKEIMTPVAFKVFSLVSDIHDKLTTIKKDLEDKTRRRITYSQIMRQMVRNYNKLDAVGLQEFLEAV